MSFITKSALKNLRKIDMRFISFDEVNKIVSDLVYNKSGITLGNKTIKEEEKLRLNKRIDKDLNALVRLMCIRSRGNARSSRNGTNNRYDNNITNLNSGYLPYITLEGESIMNLDLINSQFTLLAFLIESYFTTANISSTVVLKEQQEFHKFLSQFILTKSGKSAISKLNDVATFIELAKEGTLYEYLGFEIYDITHLDSETRNSLKKDIFAVFFSKYSIMHRSDNMSLKIRKKVEEIRQSKLLIKSIFPNLIAIVDGYKKWKAKEYKKAFIDHPKRLMKATSYLERHIDKNGKFNHVKAGSSAFAILLQSLESRIFIDIIYRKILRKGWVVLTKHDSFLFKKSDKNKITKFVTEWMDKILGEGNYSFRIEDM